MSHYWLNLLEVLGITLGIITFFIWLAWTILLYVEAWEGKISTKWKIIPLAINPLTIGIAWMILALTNGGH